MIDRLFGIDAFRLLAAFCVISLHVGLEPWFKEEIGSLVRLSGRWAIPFFFLTTGYFLGQKDSLLRASLPLAKAAIIFCVASIIMVLLDIYSIGIHKTLSYAFSGEFLFRGTYFHLWFLSSMIVGLLVVYISDYYEIHSLLPALSLVAAVFYLLAGAYKPNLKDLIGIARHFSSVIFIYAGMLISRRGPCFRASVALVALGVVMEVGEAWAISRTLNKSPYWFQFLVGTIPFSIGMFGLASNMQNTVAVRLAGRLGERYALGVYIIHPYFIVLVKGIGRTLHVDQSVFFGVALVPAIFIFSLGSLMLVNRFSPFIIDLMAADRRAIKKLDFL